MKGFTTAFNETGEFQMIKLSSGISSARTRSLLLATAATMSVAIGGAAHAQSSNVELPTNSYLSAQDGGAGAPTNRYISAQAGSTQVPVSTYLEPQIVIANPGTPTTARDPNNVTGVGQMIIDEQNGFIGLCTGTLINPRTVIFAAHCVNERAANAYGQNSGGQPIGFGFGSNNNVAGASAFGGWLNNYATNTARNMFDVNYVAYNPGSLEPDAASFLYSDIALATLDTPGKGIPTWALLFSALPATTITSAGTGYHVVIDGYGNNGTGTSGSTGGIDYRRRIAENTLGALASLNTFESFIFNSPNGLNQNLYWIDFDDPRRGTAQASVFDFNAWRDNALPNEGITASGDSGGPLILDRAFAKALVIGVLSGGYTRFFDGQPANGYGTASFYQPLYLYWDWIAANNPYHYVSAKTGNGNWTDPTHWVTNLDPNYQIIDANGNLVNGVPTTPGAGTAEQPGFGQACKEAGGVSDCYDVASGTETVVARPIGQDAAATTGNDKATVSTASLDGDASAQAEGQAPAGSQQASAQAAVAALPAPTLLNGLPGATNFVPNNYDGDRLTSTPPRYFDVTLSAAGTTTLDTAATVDRFSIAGGTAMLDITSTGSLTSLMDITQATGTMQVNGSLISGGDYLMMTGGLNGTGTIRVPYFTSVAGTIAPGTATTIGTLTFQGNVILSSGNMFLVNLGANGASDKIAVVTGAAGSGIASIGGTVGFSTVGGYSIRAGDNFTILTAQGGVTGTFTTAPISAIITPHFTVSAKAVSVSFDAGLYKDVVLGSSPVQVAYAQLLDQNRVPGRFSDLYGPLDLQNAATIRSTLQSLAPLTESTRNALGLVSVDNMARFTRDHLASIDVGNLDGSVAVIGKPVEMAALRLSATPGQAEVRSDAGNSVMEGKLPETMSGFVAGGYIDGDSAVGGGGRDQFNGFFIAAGLEKEVSERSVIGASFSYTDTSASPLLASQDASSALFQGSFYAKAKTTGGLVADLVLSVGSLNTKTVRNVSFVGTSYRLTSNANSLVLGGELGLGGSFDLGKVKVDPRVAARGTRIRFGNISEAGGGPALVYKKGNLDSAQVRAGFDARGTGMVKPYVSAYYVHDFADRPAFVGANFVGGYGPSALFPIATTDHDWAEVGAGLAYTSGKVEISVGADSTLGRNDVANQSYHGTVKFNF